MMLSLLSSAPLSQGSWGHEIPELQELIRDELASQVHFVEKPLQRLMDRPGRVSGLAEVAPVSLWMK